MDKDICIVTGSSTKTKCIKNFLEDNKEKFKGANISLCFDRDEAGFKAIDKVATELKDLDMDLKINTALSLDKDWNDQLLNYDVTNNNQAIVIDKNKEAIIEVSQKKVRISSMLFMKIPIMKQMLIYLIISKMMFNYLIAAKKDLMLYMML